MPTDSLTSLVDELFARPDDEGVSLALIVQHRGRVIEERYGTQPANIFAPATPIGADSTLTSWSMAKSVLHAAVGVLVADDLLDIDAPAPVAAWAGTPKAAITVRDLLEMRSGLRFVEEYTAESIDGVVSNCIEMLFGESGPSHAEYAASLPLEHAPGTFWNYSSGTSNIIARIVGDIVHGSSGGGAHERQASMTAFLSSRLFEPLVMDSATPKFDKSGTWVGSSYLFATARDFAKFGELYRLDGATVAGDRILPVGWVDHARHNVAHDPESGCDYGRHWWMWPQFPGSLACHGHEGQYIVVVPDRELVVVHLGKTDTAAGPQLRGRLRSMIELFDRR